MDIWLAVGTAALALSVGILVVSRLRARSNRLVRRSKPRRELEELSSPVVDESEAYWGDALPDGLGGSTPLKAQPLPVPAREAKALLTPETQAQQPIREAMPEPLRKSAPAEKALGEVACTLGQQFFSYLLERNYFLPGMRGRCSRNALVHAQRALERRAPTLPLGHGAVMQRVGEGFAVLFEPLCEAVKNPDGVLEIISAAVRDAQLFVVMDASREQEVEGASAHISRLVSRLDISANQFFLLEEDGSFHSAFEDKKHFVPCHLDATHLPESFFAKMVSYAQERFDAIEPEAALRCVEPLLEPLWERSMDGHFDGLLLAQALNLLGTAQRMLEAHHAAAACFENALYLLKQAEEYDAIQVVETNLGVSLLTLGREQPDLLREATMHFQASVKLNPQDFLCWKRLGETYRLRYSMEGSVSMLARAEHAYRQALKLRNDQEVRLALEEIAAPSASAFAEADELLLREELRESQAREIER
ncbi:MAG: hypothetical protein RBU37_14800 [Myxococcota bacterium]|jgi:tetratricopeptide (TPR) repeat protein|nr:hypothetical protein [Myxococcota bacterium]